MCKAIFKMNCVKRPAHYTGRQCMYFLSFVQFYCFLILYTTVPIFSNFLFAHLISDFPCLRVLVNKDNKIYSFLLSSLSTFYSVWLPVKKFTLPQYLAGKSSWSAFHILYQHQQWGKSSDIQIYYVHIYLYNIERIMCLY